jgi:uncharacterized protein YndB with AHSA1/START domain
MKTSVLMDFSIDRKNKKILVKREFAAPLSKVWKAWTDSSILDKWWAPKPWKAETKKMDFREGGKWLYSMAGPEGDRHWALADYTTVEPLKSFSGYDYFCDEEGNINKDLPGSLWIVNFSETTNSTIVSIEIRYEHLEDLEKIIEMGFKEGFTAGLENLDELLSSEEI